MTINSAITKDLQYATLLRGALLALFGAILLIIPGITLAPNTLSTYGPFLFFLGFGLITLGLLPYRQLTQLQMQPYQLIPENTHFLFKMKGKPIFSIPYASIDHSSFVDNRWNYGIALWIKPNTTSPVIIHSPNIDINRLRNKNQKKYGCDLFLPFFTQRSFAEFKEIYAEPTESPD